MQSKRSVRPGFHEYEIDVLESLWEAVGSYSKSSGINRVILFQEAGEKYILNPLPLPYYPERRVVPNTKIQLFKEEFPTLRTTLPMNSTFLRELQQCISEVGRKRYRLKKKVDVTVIVETIFYHFCREHHHHVQWEYFNDEYFNKHYYSNREYIKEKLQALSCMLGKSPTEVDWVEHRKDIDGPSLSFVKKQFGNFNKAKAEAKLPFNSPFISNG